MGVFGLNFSSAAPYSIDLPAIIGFTLFRSHATGRAIDRSFTSFEKSAQHASQRTQGGPFALSGRTQHHRLRRSPAYESEPCWLQRIKVEWGMSFRGGKQRHADDCGSPALGRLGTDCRLAHIAPQLSITFRLTWIDARRRQVCHSNTSVLAHGGPTAAIGFFCRVQAPFAPHLFYRCWISAPGALRDKYVHPMRSVSTLCTQW